MGGSVIFGSVNFAGAARDGLEVQIHQLLGLLNVDVARDGEDGVVGAVEIFVKCLIVNLLGCIQVFHRTDGRVFVGVGAVEALKGFFQNATVRAVVVTEATLFFHDLPLRLDAHFFDAGVEHPLAFEPEAEGKLVAGQQFVVIGAVEGSVGVVGTACLVDVVVKFAAFDVVRAFKKQVLEEVGEAGAVGFFIFGADVVHDRDAHIGRGVVFVEQDFEAIGQVVLRELDFLAEGRAAERKAERSGQEKFLHGVR